MNEKEFEKGVATLEVLKAQIINLEKQIETLNISIQEHLKAIETLENYASMSDDEILIPVGAGVFISAKVEGKKGLITIGNDIYVDLEISAIIDKLKTRIRDLEDLMKKLSEDITTLQQKYASLSAKLEEEYAKIMQQRGAQDVQGP